MNENFLQLYTIKQISQHALAHLVNQHYLVNYYIDNRHKQMIENKISKRKSNGMCILLISK